MEILTTIDEVRAAVARARAAERSIGFVPTMGALHDGHLSLIAAARASCDSVVVSIFVNPLQFGDGEDFDAYPRDRDRDLELCREAKVDTTFLPSTEDMYRQDSTTKVGVGGLGTVLEGADRPGHFDGVCTVVAKLFNIVHPDRAFFGQKDAQQLVVIRRMVADLDFPVEVVGCPTVREEDGLALSSRNAYLRGADRSRATVLYRALGAGEREMRAGNGVAAAEVAMESMLASEEGVDPSYARAVDPDTFGPPRPGRPVLLAVAAQVGPARLIDNRLIDDAIEEGA